MDVQILYKDNPPQDLRLSSEERQNAIVITIPLHKRSDGHNTATVSTAVKTIQQELQLQIRESALQFSLNGIVLDPQEDIVDLMADLPPGTRSRIVFLLSPLPQQTFESMEKPQEKEKEEKEENENEEEKKMKRGVMMFTETPPLPLPLSISTENVSVNHFHKLNHSQKGDESSFPLRRKEEEEGGESHTIHTITSNLYCVFRESWLNPRRCVRCGYVRSQHRRFTPTRQEQLQEGMITAKKMPRRRSLLLLQEEKEEEQEEELFPFERQHCKMMVKSPHICSNNDDDNTNEIKENVQNSMTFPSTYYYADPRQWKPRRDERYHPIVAACNNFLSSWGNPNLCCHCQRRKTAHCLPVNLNTPQTTFIPVKQSHNTSFSPRRTPRVACELFTPLWNHNNYCSNCYIERVNHSLESQQRPFVMRVSHSPKHSRLSPMREKKTQMTDWLSTTTCSSASGKKETMNSNIKHSCTTTNTNTTKSSLSLSVRRSQKKHAVKVPNLTLTTITSNVNNISHHPSLSTSNVSIIDCSVLPTPQRMLSFSRPSSSNAAGNCMMDSVITTTLRRYGNYSFSAQDIPWSIVLQYMNLDGLLVCREVCGVVRTAAIPLILANLRYIIDIFDVPQEKREILAECADLYASLIVKVVHQKNTFLEPLDTPTSLLSFFHYSLLELFQATQVLNSTAGDVYTLVKEELKRCGLKEPSRSRCFSSPSSIAVTIARGNTLMDDESSEDEFGYHYKDENNNNNNDIDVVVSLIQNVAYCDTASLPETASQCIRDAFEGIAVLAASSLVRLSKDGKLDDLDFHVQNTRFISLGEFFQENALMPLVDFLQAVDVVVRLKWKARRCLERLHVEV